LPVGLHRIGFWLTLLIAGIVFLAVSEYPHNRQLWGGTFSLAVLVEAALCLIACHFIGLVIRFNFARRQAIGGEPLPAILLHLGLSVLYLLTLLIVISYVFEQNVGTLLATSGAISIFIGFVLRDTILDFFTGFSLNFDETLRTHKLVRVCLRSGTEHFGTVTNISWRSTSLRNLRNETVILPNRELGFATIIQPTEPRHSIETTESLQFPLSADIDQTLSALRDAIEHCILEGTLVRDPDYAVRLEGIDRDGVSVSLMYQYDPLIYTPSAARHSLIASVLQHLKAARQRPLKPVLIESLDDRPAPLQDDAYLQLASVDLFSWLDEKTLREISARTTRTVSSPGESVVTENEPGESMYLVARGLLTVSTRGETGPVQLTVLGPGSYFGELSLLTGKPRLSTVTTQRMSVLYEVPKHVIVSLVESDADVADRLSRIVVRNRGAHDKRLELSNRSAEDTLNQEGLLKRILDYVESLRH